MVGVFAYFACVGLAAAEDAQNQSESLRLKLEDQLLVRPLVTDEEAPTFTSSKKVDGVVDRQCRSRTGRRPGGDPFLHSLADNPAIQASV